MAYPFPFVAGNILTAAELNALATVPAPGGLPFNTGFYYSSNYMVANNGNPAYQRQYFTPLIVSNTNTLTATRIAIANGTAGSAAVTFRLGIYADDNGTPGTLLLDAGTVLTTSVVSTTFEITISYELSAGIYWLSSRKETNTVTSLYMYNSATGIASDNAIYYSKQNDMTNRVLYKGFQRSALTTGAFTSVTPAEVADITALSPRVGLLV